MALGPEKRLERRVRILSATRTALAREGFDQLTMRGLARESGVTVNTLYNCFGSKAALVGAAVEDLVRHLVAEVEGDPEAVGVKRLQAAASLTTNAMESDPEYMRAVLGLAGANLLAPTATDRVREMYETGLEELAAEGSIAPEVTCAEMVNVLGALFRGINDDWARGLIPLPEVRRRKHLGLVIVLSGIAVEPLASQLRAELRSLGERTNAVDS